MIVNLTPRNLTYVFFKRRGAVFGFFAACVLLNIVYVLVTPWKYESTAQVMVKVNFNNQELARPDFGSPQSNGSSGNQQPMVSGDVVKSMVISYKSMASSQDVERATLQKLSVARVYPKLVEQKAHLLSRATFRGTFMEPILEKLFGGDVMDKAVEKLDGDIDVSQLKESNILQISVFNSDPKVAQDTVSTLLSEFFSLQQTVFRPPATAFLEGQLEVAKTRTEADDVALRDFKVAHALSSIPDEREQLLEERKDIGGSLNEARSALSGALARKHALDESLREFQTHATASSGTDAMSHQLDDAQARLTAQLERSNAAHTTYPADSPFVKNADKAVADARKRLQDIQKEIDQTVRTGASPVVQALQTDILRNDAEVSAGEAKVASISKDMAAINARLLEIDRLEGQLHQLETRVQVAQDNLRTQLQRGEESRISSDLNKSQITSLVVVQQPSFGYKIARPRWKLTTALSIFFGLFGGLLFAFLRETWSETFSLPEQLEEAVRVPVLATLNRIPV